MLGRLLQWTTPARRIDQDELLDRDEGTEEQVALSLRDLDRINRYLGGKAFLRRHVFPLLDRADPSRPLRILDLACGSAVCARWIADRVRRWGRKVEIVALDRSARHLDVARAEIARGRADGYPEITLLRADAGRLPFQAGTFDLVVSTLFLHHLSPPDLAVMIRVWACVCRGRLLLNDLVRDWVPYYFFLAARPIFARSPLTRYDGQVSLLRAYALPEMRAIAERAGVGSIRIHRDWRYYRMTLVADGRAHDELDTAGN